MKSRHFILGFLIAAIALYFTFRNADFGMILQSIKGLKYPYLILSGIVFLASFGFRALRWHFLCKSVKTIPTRRLYSPMMIGFMGNLLPMRAGEFIRAYLLGKREDIGFSSSLATIVVERLFDMFAVLVLFAGLLVFCPEVFVPHGGTAEQSEVAVYIRSFGLMSLAVVIGLIMFCYFLVHQQDKTLAFVRLLTRVLPHKVQGRIEQLLGSFTEGLGVLKDPHGLLVSILLTGCVWAGVVFLSYPLYYAFQIEALLPLSSMVTVLVVTCVLIAVMPTPGYLGPFQFAITFVLADIYSIDRSVAESFSLVSWFIQQGLVFLTGIFFLLRDNVRFSEVSRAAEKMAEAGGD